MEQSDNEPQFGWGLLAFVTLVAWVLTQVMFFFGMSIWWPITFLVIFLGVAYKIGADERSRKAAEK